MEATDRYVNIELTGLNDNSPQPVVIRLKAEDEGQLMGYLEDYRDITRSKIRTPMGFVEMLQSSAFEFEFLDVKEVSVD